MKDENFGYSLPVPELTTEDLVKDLQGTIRSYRRYTALSFLEALAIPYVAEKCSGIFPEPWNSTIASGMILLEILAVGTCLYSAYTWKRASEHLRELEQKLS